MKYVLKILVWCFSLSFQVVVANYTFDWSMEKRCKEHISQHGYSYETFYEVSDGMHRTDEFAFEMHLAILAASNGHILLSATPHPDASDPVYEIVVGGGANKFTELRRNLRRNSKYSAKTIGILSAIEYRAFYIKISHDGVIEFGKEGEILPLITYNDFNLIPVKFFSFASWNGVEAKFLYDCPRPGDIADNNTVHVSIPVVKKLSHSEELKQTLLLDKNTYLPPEKTMSMNVDVRVNSIRYNTYDAKLTAGIAMVIVWTDNSMAWNPDKFNGTKVLKLRLGQIWTPNFFVFNADDKEMLNSKNPELITMTSDGMAIYNFETTIDTWCHDDYGMASKKRWPNDEFDCTILIGAWQPHERFDLKPLYSNLDYNIVQNGWEVYQKIAIVPIQVWKTFVMQADNETNQSDRLLVNLELKRQAPAYNIVFYTPLIVLVIFMLLSFWHEPLQMSRVWFYSGCSVAICAGLCYVNDLVPCHSVPNILVLYTTVLMGILVALLVQVLLMTSVVERLCKTLLVQSMVTAKWFRMLFCLPAMKNCRIYESINEAYASPEDDDCGVMVPPRNGTVEEMQAEVTKYGEKEELAEVLDKLMFFIYSFTFVIMLVLHY